MIEILGHYEGYHQHYFMQEDWPTAEWMGPGRKLRPNLCYDLIGSEKREQSMYESWSSSPFKLFDNSNIHGINSASGIIFINILSHIWCDTHFLIDGKILVWVLATKSLLTIPYGKE